MAQPRDTRRFRINPVEIVVFGVVTLVFANSVYQLFYDWDEIRNNATGTAAAESTQENRTLASNPSLFSTVSVKCQEATTQAKKKAAAADSIETTDSAKVRLSGPICGTANKPTEKAKLVKAEVVNKTTNSTATVFTNASNGSFSTDFIQLSPGKNQIQLKWVYQGGKEHIQALVIQKN